MPLHPLLFPRFITCKCPVRDAGFDLDGLRAFVYPGSGHLDLVLVDVHILSRLSWLRHWCTYLADVTVLSADVPLIPSYKRQAWSVDVKEEEWISGRGACVAVNATLPRATTPTQHRDYRPSWCRVIDSQNEHAHSAWVLVDDEDAVAAIRTGGAIAWSCTHSHQT